MQHDPALIAEVRAWLSKAGKDLAAAEYELKAEPPFADDIVFHAQQATEKSMKAFHRGMAFHFAKRTTWWNWAKPAAKSMHPWNPCFAGRHH